MRNPTRKILLLLAVTSLVAAAAPALGQTTRRAQDKTPPLTTAPAQTQARRLQLIGQTKAVWLLVRDDAAGYKLAVQARTSQGDSPEKSWRRVGTDRSGNVVAAAAVGENLTVFFADAEQMRYSPQQSDGHPGILPPPEIWPEGTRLLAATGAADGSEAVLLLVARPARQPAATRPDDSLPAGIAPGGNVPDELAVLRYTGVDWQHVSVIPFAPAQPVLRAHLAAHGKTIYVLIEQTPEHVLMAAEAGKWRKIALPESIARSEPLAVTIGNGALAVTVFDRASRAVSIGQFASGKWKPVRKVRRGQEKLTWPADDPPAVGKFGRDLVFTWIRADQWFFARCSLDGDLSREEPLDVFAKAQAQELSGKIQQFFFWGVFGVIFALMFWPGQTLRTTPFTLPPTFFPAGLGKRLIAGAIDSLPWLFAVYSVAFASTETELKTVATFDQAYAQARELAYQPQFLYAFLAFLVIYPAYCFIMEYRCGATFGKMAMRLRVVGNAGAPVTMRESALRNISKITEILGLILIFPLLFPILTRYRQRLGDKISWTAVIDAQRSVPPPPPAQPTGSEDDKPTKDG